MTETMTEDTPDDSIELLKWKLERLTAEYEKLNHAYRQNRDIAYVNRQDDRDQILKLEVLVEKLTSVMSVTDLRKAGINVIVDFDNEDD